MGEHIKVDGQNFKLGTCEDMYYIRYGTLEEWVKAGRVEDGIGEMYLKPNIFRFRFPFPDEDEFLKESPVDMEQEFWARGFERGITVAAPVDVMAALHLHHSSIYKAHGTNGGGRKNEVDLYSFNLWFPCPYGADWENFIGVAGVGSSSIPQNMVQIVQQKPVAGEDGTMELWTVIRCAYCTAKVRLNRAQAGELAAMVARTHSEIARRIMAGYSSPIG